MYIPIQGDLLKDLCGEKLASGQGQVQLQWGTISDHSQEMYWGSSCQAGFIQVSALLVRRESTE